MGVLEGSCAVPGGWPGVSLSSYPNGESSRPLPAADAERGVDEPDRGGAVPARCVRCAIIRCAIKRELGLPAGAASPLLTAPGKRPIVSCHGLLGVRE